MLAALGRLLLISALTLLGAIFVVFLMRAVGLQQNHTRYNHPLIEKNSLIIIAQHPSTPLSRQSLTKSRELSKEVFWQAPIHLTKDGQWIIRNSPWTSTSPQKPIQSFSLDQLQAHEGNHILTLKQLFKSWPKQKLLVVVHQKEKKALEQLASLLKQNTSDEDLLLASPIQSALAFLKEKLPQWLFICDPTTLARARLLSGIYLEPLATLPYDLYAEKLSGSLTPPRLAHELSRRHRGLILQANTLQELQNHRFFNYAKGVLTSNPHAFVQRKN